MKLTKAQLIEFQNHNTDWQGKPLVVDGDCGPRTEWALALSKLDRRRQVIVKRACSMVGLMELDINRGPEIDQWLSRCGAPLGSAWCAAYASWCLSAALGEVAIAGAQELGKHYPPTFNPLPGDLMWFATGSWQGHIGIYIGGNLIEAGCVEGNSANMVRLTRRLRRDVCFSCILPDDDTSVPLPLGLPIVSVASSGTR